MASTRNRIAVVRGTALVPGASKNRRLYTEENIASAYARLAERLADPEGRPVVMRSFHPDPEQKSDMSVGHIAGRVTEVSLQDGKLCWVGELADTQAGRDVAALTTPAKPYLANVSIRGRWASPVYRAAGCETADDLEIDGIDFTPNPGVDGARIENARLTEAERRATHAITESVEDAFVETAPPATEADAQTPGSNYADPGYQADKKKRYPLDTNKHIRAAWAYINVADNQKPYTAAQLKRIRSRIKAAAKKAGINIAEETAQLAAELAEVIEAYASVCLDNGPADIRVSGYVNEPADLPALGARLATAALAGLFCLDPDNDGDIDGVDDDGKCPSCSAELPLDAKFCPACGAELPESDSTESAPTSGAPAPAITEGVTTVTTPAAPTAGTPAASDAKPAEETTTETGEQKPAEETKEETAETTASPLTEDAIAAAVAKGVSEALAALKPEAAKPAEETSTTEKSVSEQVTEAVAAQVKDIEDRVRADVLKAYGPPRRKGLVALDETAQGSKPLHEMSDEEWREARKSFADVVLPVPGQ